MKIAITCFFQFSMFSNGSPSTSVSLAEALTTLGHDITLVNITKDKTWYDDCKLLEKMFKVQYIEDCSKTDLFDILIDVEGYIVSEKRNSIAKHVVTFMRKPVFLNEMEASVYPIAQPIRDLSGVDAIWHWDTHIETDSRFLEVLYKKPVFRIPYTWSPGPIETYVRETGMPHWITTTTKVPSDKEWECHVLETNTSMGSSCVIPMVVLAHVKRSNIIPISEYAIHNADHIKENKFFKENVHEHCQVEGLKNSFLGRQRCTDWRTHPKSFALCHLRFNVIKPALLDLAWNGIPVIHNSIWLKSLGNGLERFYYEDNSIVGAATAIKNMNDDFQSNSGFFSEGNLLRIRTALLVVLDPKKNDRSIESWKLAIESVLSSARHVPTNSSTVAPTLVANAVPTGKINSLVQKRILHIGFSDMWDDFNPVYNFFTLLLDTAVRQAGLDVEIRGVDARTIIPDLLIFGPFGSFWKTLPLVPKVHFTGESTDPIKEDGVFLNLGYKAMTQDDTGYIRLPLWMLEIDWFGANKEKIVNPKPLPIDACCKPFSDLSRKTKFCAFVVTNPMNPMRNNAFHWLSSYKQVDSAGRLFNNVGDVIFAGLGGGGGELKKHEFLMNYKFCLAYENKSDHGYTTEKWLHAKAAGCIPIYWGDPYINREFDANGFINANDISDPESLIALVEKVDSDNDLYKKMMETPALDDYRRDLVRRRFSEIASRMLEKCLGNGEITLPKFLGATCDKEAAELRFAREGDAELVKVVGNVVHKVNDVSVVNPTEPVLISYATLAYLPSIFHWIRSTGVVKNANPSTIIRVYLGADVPAESYKTLCEDYPYVEWTPMTVQPNPDFLDMWNPEHFVWKLWILNTLCKDESLKGHLVWYFDAGCMYVCWPGKYIQSVITNGICVLEDSRQKNDQWCHEAFCKYVGVTKAELDGQQIWAGSLAFVAGSALATELFEKSWVLAQVRDVIVGPKWSGRLADGRPYGHRHDQSILSVLSQRLGVARYPLDILYCDVSMRRTHQDGCAIYCHRGNFKEFIEPLPGISEIHIISLAKRQDRLEKFKANHSWKGAEIWRKQICIRPAVDGRKLTMTPSIARLFAPNDFKWKKAILGCALSHLSLWEALSKEKLGIENYLILEDDVKFTPEWEKIWIEASKCIPEDYDVLYLGGVLPPNRNAFNDVLEPVNFYWGRVMPNQIFGQSVPNSYFHFCNYSYILTKSGAQKVLADIKQRGGYYTSADHMICNQISTLKHYVLRPQVAGCYQDDDPKYKESEFNNFNRVDAFDSDLWNNDERWSMDELNALGGIPSEISIEGALRDAYRPSVSVSAVTNVPVVGNVPINELVKQKPIVTEGKPRFLTVSPHLVNMSGFLEKRWLKYLLGKNVIFTFSQVSIDDAPADDEPIFLVQRPHLDLYMELFKKYDAAEKSYRVLHLSDEITIDNISFYLSDYCKAVVRTYPRNDIPESVKEKVLTIPLGYAKHSESGIEMAWVETPSLPFRQKKWTFYGTKWLDREAKLQPLKILESNHAIFYDSWLDPNQLNESDYIGQMLNSVFVPCPRGQHVETFRVYEALEHGAFPIIVREEGDSVWFDFLHSKVPVLSLPSWSHAAAFMKHLLENPDILDKYRTNILVKRAQWKAELQESVRKLYKL